MKELPVDKRHSGYPSACALKIDSGKWLIPLDKNPATLNNGDEKIVPQNFEAYLRGMKAGDKAKISGAPEKSLWPRQPQQTYR